MYYAQSSLMAPKKGSKKASMTVPSHATTPDLSTPPVHPAPVTASVARRSTRATAQQAPDAPGEMSPLLSTLPAQLPGNVAKPDARHASQSSKASANVEHSALGQCHSAPSFSTSQSLWFTLTHCKLCCPRFCCA
jgi:hypothetical protein